MNKETNCYVVFDANILIKDFWLRSEGFVYLKIHQFLGHRPMIPEVAFLEARNNLQKRAEELLSHKQPDGNRSRGNIRRLLGLFNFESYSEDLSWDVEEMILRWNSNIQDMLHSNGGAILPSSELEIDDLIKRSINRQKPFSKGDSDF